jgi:hypothetical protein
MNDCSWSIRSTLCLNQMTNQTRKVTNGQSNAQIGHIADDRWIQQRDALSRQIFHFFHANNESAPLTAAPSSRRQSDGNDTTLLTGKLNVSATLDGDGVDKGNLTGRTRSVKRTILLFFFSLSVLLYQALCYTSVLWCGFFFRPCPAALLDMATSAGAISRHIVLWADKRSSR